MKAVKIGSRGCRDSKRSLKAGKKYKVPGQVSLEDAKTLIMIGKATAIGDSPVEPGAMTTETAGAVIDGAEKK